MVGKIKSWMFASVIIVLVELGQLARQYHLAILARSIFGLALLVLVAMGIHYFFMKMRK